MKAQKRLATFKTMLKKFKKFIQTGKLKVTIKNGKMVLELPSAVLFELGKADLSADGKKTLATVASVLRTIKGREFQVAGHTDNIRLTDENPFKSNWELSAARAVKVVQFLENKGVASRNLSAAGYSQFQPTATNKTEAGQAKNRRIEITLMPDMEELPNLSELQKLLKKK
jgi:chemotaxis protein MotB